MPDKEHTFDNLAKGLASRGISRGRMLTMVATAIVGTFLGTFALPDETEAKKKGKGKAKKKKKCQGPQRCAHNPVGAINGCCRPGFKCCDFACCLDLPE